MSDFFKFFFFRSNPNEIGVDGHTPLQKAILHRDLKTALALIKKGADVNLRGDMAQTPLHLALERGNHSIVVALIRAGADVNRPDLYGQTPLHYAVKEGQESFVLTLLKLGADPNARDDGGMTPLHMVSSSFPQIIDVLVQHNARVNEKDRDGNTPLHYCIETPARVERLLAHGADPNVVNFRGVSPYVMMLDEGRLRHYPEVLQRMISFKANIASTNRFGETILHLAARLELTDVFQGVLGRAELEARDANGNNVLHALVRTYNVQMIPRVLERAPQLISQTNNDGQTPLGALLHAFADRIPSVGAVDKALTAASVLLDHKANPDCTDGAGHSLLHYAIAFNKLSFLDEALVKGVNPDLRDVSGKTALHHAIEQGNLRAIDILLDRDANPDMTDARGWTILDRLAEAGDRDSSIVQRLIVAGGRYQKQLPLHPDMMRRPKVLDKGQPSAKKAPPYGPKIG